MSLPEEQLDGQALINYYARTRRRSALLILGALLAAVVFTAVAALLQQSVPLPPPDYSKMGVHLLLDDGRNHWNEALWGNHLAYAARITGRNGMVIQVIRGDDLGSERWQKLLDLSVQYHLAPVLRLSGVYDREKQYWLPPVADADGGYQTVAHDYADFLRALNWHDLTPSVILLNEPNNGSEWAGYPDPAAYARFVMDTVPVLREAVPGIKILNAALDLYAPNTGSQPFNNGLRYMDANSFMEAMHQAQPRVFEQFDYWNSHPYPTGPFREPPWKQEFRFDALNDAVISGAVPPTGIFNRGVNGYEWELWKLSTWGITDLKVVVTETGYRYAARQPESMDAADDYPVEEVAYAYLELALRGNTGLYNDVPASGWTPLLRDNRVVAVAVFALDGFPAEWAHTSLLKMNPDGTVADTSVLFDILAKYQSDS